MAKSRSLGYGDRLFEWKPRQNYSLFLIFFKGAKTVFRDSGDGWAPVRRFWEILVCKFLKGVAKNRKSDSCSHPISNLRHLNSNANFLLTLLL
jgi:hypothetical protein